MKKLLERRRERGKARPRGGRLWGRIALTISLAAGFATLLAVRLGDLDVQAVGEALSDLHVLQWSGAALATALSFWAVGHYDAVVHRHFATGVPGPVARRAGISAIAVSQMLGLGVVTGSILRWRMLPDQSLALATRLTLAVALSFLAGWAVVTAAVVLAIPAAPFKVIAALVIVGAGVVAVLVIVAPQTTRRWPNLLSMARLVALAAVDTLAAGVALFLLLPVEVMLPFFVLLPAFLIAQGAGLVSGTPGGVGAFEVTLLALLPPQPAEPLLAAILGWRAIYYAAPAVLGGLLAAIGPTPARARSAALPALEPRRAEALILHQGEHHLLHGSGWVCGKTAHLLVGLFDPACPGTAAMEEISLAAQAATRLPALYKCSERTAVIARRDGWQTLRIAREAVLAPDRFNLCAASRAGLRRKLRRAEAAGVTVLHIDALPLAEMADVAAQWAAAHGGERGFSMGRFAPGYVARQRVYLARRDGRLVAFITCHQGSTEWVLDLMRHVPGLPDGTMHALVAAAIADAARLAVPRLSLAAVPEAAFGHAGRLDRLLRRFGCDGQGLLRFKNAFAPQWQPLYLAAPGRISLSLACFEIARAIAAPARLPESEQDHVDYEFASAPGPWQRQPE